MAALYKEYKIKDGSVGGVIKVGHNLGIPKEPKNRHWQEYLRWVEEGNKPDPADD